MTDQTLAADYSSLVAGQRAYFKAGHTRPVEYRLAGLIGSGMVAAGGQTDPDELHIAPTVLVDVPVDSPIMQEEVFGPIHSPRIDPGVKYPPYAEHTGERKVMDKLL